MDIETFRIYCLAKKAVTESFPFDSETLVFKVCGKMFALTGLNQDLSINLKCDPDFAIELREQYPCVQPGFHMNKQHWNTVEVDGSVSDAQLCKWIDHSYDLVASKLTKKEKQQLGIL